MKILGTGIIPSQIDKYKPRYQQTFQGKSDLETDTFEKTNNEASSNPFGLSQEQSRKILSNPELMQGFSKFISDGLTNAYLKLMELANGGISQSERPITTQSVQTDSSAENKKIERQEEKIAQLKEEIAKLKEENKNTKEKLHEALTKIPVGYTSGITIVYPRKVGITKEEIKLRELLETMLLPREASRNLTDVLIAVHNKPERSIRDEYVDRLYKDISENKTDIPQLTKIIDGYYKELYFEAYTDDAKSEEISQNSKKEEKPALEKKDFSNEKLITINFPKRPGMLSKELISLKETVAKTQIPESLENKFKTVCAMFSLKGADKQEIISFTSALKRNENNQTELAELINEHYERFSEEFPDAFKVIDEKFKIQEKPIVKTTEKEEIQDSVVEQKEDLTTKAERQQTTETQGNYYSEIFPEIKLNIKGKIDLDKVDPKRKTTAAGKETAKVTTTAKPQADTDIKTKEEAEQNTKIDCSFVKRDGGFYYEHPQELPYYVSGMETEINEIIKFFKKMINPKDEKGRFKNRRINWLERSVIKDNVKLPAIIAEIKKVNEHTKGYPKSFRSLHEYNNINIQNAFEFEDIVNSEKFKNLFTLHSALRLIDRYGNFEDGIPTVQQCEELVDCLKDSIHNALTNGVNFEEYIDNYSDPKKPQHGVKVIVHPEYFSAKAKEYFGNHALVITFCEQKNSESGLGAISTLYSDLEDKYRQPIQ